MSLFHGITTAVLSGREARSCASAAWAPRAAHFGFALMRASQVLGDLSGVMDGPNTAQQNFIMQLSMARSPLRRRLRALAAKGGTPLTPFASCRLRQGYFVLDSLHVIAYRLDPLFVLHHAQTLTYMVRPGRSGAARARRPHLTPARALPDLRFGVACSAAAPCPSCG